MEDLVIFSFFFLFFNLFLIFFFKKDKWNGIAVVIDNFSTDGLSTISLHFNDGTRRYDFDTDGDSTRLGTCRYKLRNVKDLSALHLYIENDKVNVSKKKSIFL